MKPPSPLPKKFELVYIIQIKNGRGWDDKACETTLKAATTKVFSYRAKLSTPVRYIKRRLPVL